MGRRASRTACQTCRDRHLKCDSVTLPCYNCTKSRKECRASSWWLFQAPSSNPSVRHQRRHSSKPLGIPSLLTVNGQKQSGAVDEEKQAVSEQDGRQEQLQHPQQEHHQQPHSLPSSASATSASPHTPWSAVPPVDHHQQQPRPSIPSPGPSPTDGSFFRERNSLSGIEAIHHNGVLSPSAHQHQRQHRNSQPPPPTFSQHDGGSAIKLSHHSPRDTESVSSSNRLLSISESSYTEDPRRLSTSHHSGQGPSRPGLAEPHHSWHNTHHEYNSHMNLHTSMNGSHNHQQRDQPPPPLHSQSSAQAAAVSRSHHPSFHSTTASERQTPADWTAEDFFATRAHPSPIDSEDLTEPGKPPVVGIQTEAEANLLRYFIQEWGPLLDATDETRQFSTSIPHLAWTESPCLLYAILALVSVQLSKLSEEHSTQTARYYRKKCAQVLIPILLEDPDSVHEASIFATYVLLRVYDHLAVNLSERQPESLFSEGLALSTKPWNAYSNKAALKRAAFWIHLRQDIHVALILGCPVRVEHTLYEQTVAFAIQITDEDFRIRLASRRQSDAQKQQQHHQSHHSSDQGHQSPQPLTNIVGGSEDRCGTRVDCAWANRLVGLACRIINYCFDSRAQSIEEWTSLLVELESWNLRKPDSFRPFFELPPDPAVGRPFPVIHLQNDCHVIGMIYYHTSVALLKSQRPGSCCQSGNLREVGYGTREEILNQARLLCGVTKSNPISQCLLIACPMISVLGKFFGDKLSQQGTLEILELIKQKTGAPAELVRDKLTNYWASSS